MMAAQKKLLAPMQSNFSDKTAELIANTLFHLLHKDADGWAVEVKRKDNEKAAPAGTGTANGR